MNANVKPKHPRGEEDYRKLRRFAREAILQILFQSDIGHSWQWTEEEQQQFWRQSSESNAFDRDEVPDKICDFINRMIAGICSEKNNIDLAISNLTSHWSLERMSIIDRNILRLAVYEIRYRDDIPPVASINEAVELAKKFGDKDSPRFVNGILDRLLKDNQ